MGVRNFLIEVGSGTGKTSVAEELQRRGYDVVHGYRVLAYYGDPNTGVPMQAPSFDHEMDAVSWGYEHWIWPVEKVERLVADRHKPASFFCGHSANADQFIGLFDGVFILDVDTATLNQRLAGRPEDEFGGRSVERELVLHLHETKEGLPKGATVINTDAPIGQVVDEIVSKCGLRDRGQA